ncbi:oxygen-independent coproporphyrinogen III oxidase [Parabacteroides sp. OttesenSCG-928-N08]|nr:oxygen-independent coproporphyrinogen III oxidase [Parabacteroides sp. OttesenSCG-928-N08]
MNQEELLHKYNLPVPRYTSYPPANCFEESFGGEHYAQAIERSNGEGSAHLSFYLHIPFCRHLCHYCGCNSMPIADAKTVERYLAALHKEIDRVVGLLDSKRHIAQIHYGGGTPTILPVKALTELNQHLMAAFPLIDRPEIAIECHPGYLDEAGWQALTEAGFNRFSLGVQDLNREVLKAVNRRPAMLPLETIFALLRQKRAAINVDLLYGLPLQTVDGFRSTVEELLALQPDRLVTFSYAHVPWVNKQQLLLEKRGLPSPDEKNRLFEEARRLLLQSGYQAIGLDHFVRPDDELFQALKEGQLRRNFQGYCTARTTGQVYAFGVTGISQLHTCYAQNNKELHAYMQQVEAGEWTTVRGYQLNAEELITKEVIETLMCNYAIDWQAIANRLQLTVEAVKQATAYNEELFRQFAHDGIIDWSHEQIRIKPAGKLFVRNVAAALDKRMLKNQHHYSKPI